MMKLATDIKGKPQGPRASDGFECHSGNMQIALRLPKPAFRAIDILANSIGKSRVHTIRMLIDAGFEARKHEPKVAEALTMKDGAL
jgi:predicted DNA-binding protein